MNQQQPAARPVQELIAALQARGNKHELQIKMSYGVALIDILVPCRRKWQLLKRKLQLLQRKLQFLSKLHVRLRRRRRQAQLFSMALQLLHQCLLIIYAGIGNSTRTMDARRATSIY